MLGFHPIAPPKPAGEEPGPGRSHAGSKGLLLSVSGARTKSR